MTYTFTKVVKSIVLPALIMGLTTANLYAQKADSTKTKTTKATKPASKAISVKGTITDSQTDKGLPGISVQIAEYSAAITDEKGQFVIDVPSLNATLVVTGQGYQNKEIPLKGRTSVTASLYNDTYNSVYGTVMMPFGPKSKAHVANSVSSVNVNDSWQRTNET